MTDKEIIKALSCCVDDRYPNCSECPAVGRYRDVMSCEEVVKQSALDLVKRQQEEIERLRDDNKFLEDRRFKEWCVVKAEAIKEFAKRLKVKRATHYCEHCGREIDYTDVFNDGVDIVLEEMVGEE